MKKFLLLVLVLAFSIAGPAESFAKGGKGGSSAGSKGSSGSSNKGGTYVGGKGSSHKGGTYAPPPGRRYSK